MAQYEIPLSAQAQRFSIDLADKTYVLRVQYAEGWFIDIADDAGADLVTGVPLVCGIDLLGQHKHLGVGGKLFLSSLEPPAYSDLGTASRLIFQTE